MRLIITLFALILIADSTRFQAFSAPAKARGEASPEAALALKQAEAKELVECNDRWDAATHMTRKQWARACLRIRDRLRLLDLQGSTR